MSIFLSGETEQAERELLCSLGTSRNYVAVGIHSTEKCGDFEGIAAARQG
ncbi:hypothetical protein M8013_15560 [Enterobacteriaceae bacterium H4N4]|uniref:Uncharacterized protein n=1 Tax=Silvania confinis TaxID=2926470 RepID=A0A9J6QPK3_9ENTR|nr:hypothetical protein [Silvania confinis]MCU6670157.1 hypothetical protein [Silvania confinis]